MTPAGIDANKLVAAMRSMAWGYIYVDGRKKRLSALEMSEMARRFLLEQGIKEWMESPDTSVKVDDGASRIGGKETDWGEGF